MLDLLNSYCCGYLATPIIEAFQQRGVLELLDSVEFHERASLIKKFNANAGYLLIALEILESLGWVEKNMDDGYRLATKVEGYGYLGLTPLYAIEPEQLTEQETHAHVLREKIEQV